MSHQDVVIAMWSYGIFGHRPDLSGQTAMAAAALIAHEEDALLHESNGGQESWHRNHVGPPSDAASTMAAHSERYVSSFGTSTSASPSSSFLPPSPPGIVVFVSALVALVRRRLRQLRPKGLSNVIKALGSLRVAGLPDVQSVAREAAKLAEAKMEDFRPDEVSNLLYGLSLMRYNELPVRNSSQYVFCPDSQMR